MAEANKIIRRNAHKGECVVPEYREEQPDVWTDDLEKAHPFPESRANAIVEMLARRNQPDAYVTDMETERTLLAEEAEKAKATEAA